MDNLETLKGIGRATAERLVKAGISSFALLAAATDEQLGAIEHLGGDATTWSKWRAEAANKAPAPRAMTAEELSALVAKWDAARTALKEAGDAVAALQADGNASADDIEAALQNVTAAETAIASLTPLPEGLTLPAAQAKPAEVIAPAVVDSPTSGEVLAAAAAATLASVSFTDTTPQTSPGGGNSAAPAPDLVSGVCLTNVRWKGKTHEPKTVLELPRLVAGPLVQDGAFTLA